MGVSLWFLVDQWPRRCHEPHSDREFYFNRKNSFNRKVWCAVEKRCSIFGASGLGRSARGRPVSSCFSSGDPDG